jgi:hypothetical protein
MLASLLFVNRAGICVKAFEEKRHRAEKVLQTTGLANPSDIKKSQHPSQIPLCCLPNLERENEQSFLTSL